MCAAGPRTGRWQPNSKEFFSNIDPLYRTYNKQDALKYQLEYFQDDPKIEEEWLQYCDYFKAIANWYKNVANPFGDPEGVESSISLSKSSKENQQLHQTWREKRSEHKGFVDPRHPYRYQGEGKPYTYKMFSELGHIITREGGRFGFITPSGVYSDKGSSRLRDLFLSRCNWTHLYAFQNERFIFASVDHRFKMVISMMQKGATTSEIATRFRLGPGDSPEAYELEVDIPKTDNYLSVPVAQIQLFSPKTGAMLEIRTQRDLMILQKMYNNGILLGDNSSEGWGIQYRQGDFNMTSDSKLFPPRSTWEAKGYQPDEYGHWLKGEWKEFEGERSDDLILSANRDRAIHIDDVEDIALPLYAGKMIWHFDFSWSKYISGSGNRAVWEDSEWQNKQIAPQYLMSAEHQEGFPNDCKLVMRDVSSSTNTRTFVTAIVPNYPSGHKLPRLLDSTTSVPEQLALESILASFSFDYVMRLRHAASSIILSTLIEVVVVPKNKPLLLSQIALIAARLSLAHVSFAPSWIKLASSIQSIKEHHWKQLWAIAPYERLRLRCILDAVVAHLYGLSEDDFRWILRDCDHAIEIVNDKAQARKFDPKGFWRVDKDKPPELRHTVLAQIAFHDLQTHGLDSFLNLNNGEGWMLPETLRLSDYGLGRDDRARMPQPVAEILGDRFLPWQLESSIEDSWTDCENHANRLKRLLGTPEPANDSLPPADPNFQPPTDLFGNPLQIDLFGNVVEEPKKRKRK